MKNIFPGDIPMGTGHFPAVKKVILLLALLSFVGAGKAIADSQSNFNFWITIEKTEQIDSATLMLTGTVAGLPVKVAVDANTSVHDLSGQALRLDAIRPDTTILVKAEWKVEYFLAQEVAVGNAGEVVLTGILESASASGIRVAGTDVKLGDFVLPAAITPGQLVVVRGLVDPAGGLVVLSLELQHSFQLFGAIAAIEKMGEHEVRFVVASREVRATDDDTVITAAEAARSTQDLALGLIVNISGEILGDIVIAKKIQIFDPKNVIVSGRLSTIDSQTLSLIVSENSVSLRTDRQTEVVGDLSRSTTVGVRATLQSDGSLLANRISAGLSTLQETKPAVIRGIIDKITGLTFSLQGGQVIITDTATVIVSKGVAIKFSDLKAGDQVGVAGTRRTDGAVLATRIEVIPAHPIVITIRGTIACVSGSSLQVGSDKVVVGAQTMIVSKGKMLSLGDLKAGDQVVVAGTRQSDNTLAALRIEVIPPAPAWITVHGLITSIDTSSFQVGTNNIIVDSQTVIDSLGKTASFSSLKAGDQVMVVGTKQTGSSVLATRIEVIKPLPVIITVRGAIASINSPSFIVGGTKVLVDANTKIVSKGTTVAFAALKVGDQVIAVGTKQTDNSVLATRIEVITPLPVIATVHGAIASISYPSFTVGGAKVLVDANTKIFSKGVTVAFATLKVGDQVIAVGTKQTDNSVLATRIEVITPQPVITTVRGAIANIGSASFTVGATIVLVDANTKIVSKGVTVAFATLKVGDQVTIVGTKQSNGSILALKIEISA
jgi:hypothetical protein